MSGTIKTSAIKDYNAAIVLQNGKVGTVRYYTKNGLTYVRAASNSTVTNNRTNAQMTQRLKFASLAALYSTLGSHLKGAFPNKAKNQSDFNAYIQANQGEGVYLTKQNRALGNSIALPVVVSSGKLVGVTTTMSGSNAVTDLKIGSLVVAGAKVSELSAALVAGNPGWAYGDQLTIVTLRQDGNYCRPQYVRIVLNSEDSTLLSAYGTFSAVSNCLAYAVTGNACVGFIHSSADGGMSQTKLAANDGMVTIINSYLSDDAFATASASYGTSTETFLVPTKGATASRSTSNTPAGNTTVGKKTLTLTASPAEGGTVTGGGQYDAGATATINAVANTGYTFSQWNDGNTSASRTVTVNSDMNLQATFTNDSNPNGVGGMY